MTDGFWIAIAPTSAIIATGIVQWFRDNAKLRATDKVAEKVAEATDKTEVLAKTLDNHGTVEIVKLDQIHKLVNSEAAKQRALISKQSKMIAKLEDQLLNAMSRVSSRRRLPPPSKRHRPASRR